MAEPFRFCPRCAAPLGPLEDEEGTPRVGCAVEGCGYVFYDNPTPVSAVLVEHEGCVILARNRTWPEKVYSLITGFVERGEDPADTARRETEEELGLTPGPATLIGVYGFAPLNQVLIAYHVAATGEVQLGAELAEYKAVPLQKLKGWGFGPGLAVRDWLAKR